MTGTPTYPWLDQLGRYVIWTVCSAPGDTQCSNLEVDYDNYVVPEGDWGDAVAAFGRNDSEKVFGRRITARLIERYQDPNWVPGTYDPDDPNTWAGIIERIIPTYTESIILSTTQEDQIDPRIELYDGGAGEISVAGIIDGTYYVYPVVFQDAQFCYLPRCSGTGPNMREHCLHGGWFPLEPFDPDCNPPVYPMDSITAFVPSSNTEEDIYYKATWNFYVNDGGESDNQTPQSFDCNIHMDVFAPSEDWQSLMMSMMSMTYFYNGIYH